jgi:Carboxypeptidase regulatory-like domain
MVRMVLKGLHMRIGRLVLLLILFRASSFAGPQVANDPGEPGVITGTVIDSVGHPLRDARIYVKEHNRPQTGVVRYVTTDENGEFRLVNLRPGDYDVLAVPSGSTSMLSRWRQRVHLPKGQPIGKVTIQIGSSTHVKS